MHKYLYNGPVMEFSRCIAEHWSGWTCASSEQKARNNLTYHFKRDNNRQANSKIELPGRLTIEW